MSTNQSIVTQPLASDVRFTPESKTDSIKHWLHTTSNATNLQPTQTQQEALSSSLPSKCQKPTYIHFPEPSCDDNMEAHTPRDVNQA